MRGIELTTLQSVLGMAISWCILTASGSAISYSERNLEVCSSGDLMYPFTKMSDRMFLFSIDLTRLLRGVSPRQQVSGRIS